jgi:predicted ATPase
MVLEAYSVSHGKASAYLSVIDLLHGYFEITSDDDAHRRREKVAGKVLMLDRTLEDALPYLFSLLGIADTLDPLAQMDGQVKKRRTLEAIKRILLRESLNQALMLVFEDLHWIDSETQALLNLLADGIANAQVLLMVNYRPEYHHEWGKRTYYTQLRLDPLGKENAGEMLSALLSDAPELASLKRTITEQTEGNPFFIEELVQALFDEGALVRNGTIKITRPLSQLRIPPTAQAVLAARIDRLPAELKNLLQTLAVIGREFPLGLIRSIVPTPDSKLDRMLSELQLAEFIYEQPAFPEIEYIFKHALTQEVAYNSLLIERRKHLHERAGEALESMYAEQLDDHLPELARHFSRSDNVSKAVEYLGRAGQQAVQRSAYTDAVTSLTTAKELLATLADGTDRLQEELRLELCLAQALTALKGMPAPEVERAYTRARELCERLSDPPKLFLVLFGLSGVHSFRGELPKAHELAERLLLRAAAVTDSAPVLCGDLALATTCYWMGELLLAREHCERAIALYDPERNGSLTLMVGFDLGVVSRALAAASLWHLGYPDQARKKAEKGLVLAQTLSHPATQVIAEFCVCTLHQLAREPQVAEETAQHVMAMSAEHGFPLHSAYASVRHGWAIAVQGRHEEGISQIREGLAALSAIGEEIERPYNLCLLADACLEAGRIDDGLDALREALAAAGEHEHRYEAEIHRLKGELLLKRDRSNDAEAESCFERAIEIARKQSAKSQELRATLSLARLLAKQSRRGEARAMLAEIYNWFTEGFDTADLKDAKALRDELSGQ